MEINLFTETRVALTIESSDLRLLIVKGRQVRGWMSYPLPADVLQGGTVVAAEPFQAALAALFYGREGLRNRISVCFPGGRSLFRTTLLPKLKPRHLTEAIEREAQRELPLNKEKAHLFWQKMKSDAQGQHYFLASIRKDAYDRLYDAFRGARMSPRMWEMKPLALVRAVNRPQAIILDLERDSTDLILVIHGVPRLFRSLAAMPDAPREERAKRWGTEITRSIDYYNASQPEQAWEAGGPVVLTGQLARDKELFDAMEAASPIPVQAFECPFEAPPEFPLAAYAAAVGMAMKRGRPSRPVPGAIQIDFNVFPQEYRRSPLPVKQVAAAMALLVATAGLVPVYQVKASQDAVIEAQQEDLSRMRRQVSMAKGNLLKRSDLQKQIDQTLAQASGLQGERRIIFSTGGGVAGDMQIVLDLAPPGARVLRYSVQGNVMLLDGEAATFDAALLYARALEQSARFQRVTLTSLSQREGAGGTVAFILSIGRKGVTG